MEARPDAERVRALLGREPQGRFEVVVRDDSGDPVVLENAPLLDDGTPMPTRFWLIGTEESRRIAHLEAAGGVNAAEAAVDPTALADAHRRYAAERDAEIPAGHTGPRPSGGVGGTRIGVKCLHAHWAWHLAGGDDPVGKWIAAQFANPTETLGQTAGETATFDVADDATSVHVGTETHHIPWGPRNLTARWLSEQDPPRPEDLTNAFGLIDDHLDDVLRELPAVRSVRTVTASGGPIGALARLEVGLDAAPSELELDRAAAEEVFRLVATETRAERAHNPGLPFDAVQDIVATCVIVLAVMRRLDLPTITLDSDGRT